MSMFVFLKLRYGLVDVNSGALDVGEVKLESTLALCKWGKEAWLMARWFP